MHASKKGGACLNGFIRYPVVVGYVEKILDIFRNRKNFLNKLQDRFEREGKGCFTEMWALGIYLKESGARTFRINKVLDGCMFDDNISSQCDLFDVEMKYDPVMHRELKKLYFREGSVFEKINDTGELVRLTAVNLSCVPANYFKEVVYRRFYGKQIGLLERLAVKGFWRIVTNPAVWRLAKAISIRRAKGKGF